MRKRLESTAWPPPACCGGEDGKKGRDDSNLGHWLGCQTKLSSSWYSRLSFIFPIVQLLGQPAHYLHSCQHFQVANRDKQAHPSALTSIVAVYYWIYTIIPKSSSTQPPQTVLPPSTSEGTALLTGGRPGGGTAWAGWAACPYGPPGAPGQPAELHLPSAWETGQQAMDFIPYGFQTDLHSMLQTW